MMIETPAAALCAAELAGQSAFFSIGTNDLVQYTLAADRGNERLRGLQNADHPAVLALIRHTCEAAQGYRHPGRRVRRAAGDPAIIPKLLEPRCHRAQHGRPLLIPRAKKVGIGAVRARVFPDYEAMSAAAADAVARKVGKSLRRTPAADGDHSSRDVPAARGDAPRGELSFALATFFNLDEYLGLPPDHPASYHVYMKENFYGLIDADPARVFVPEGDAPDPEAECERYEAAIREAGGIDLCVLGIGRNGHIGFNEPGAPFDSRTRVVRLSESTRRVNAADFEADRAPERAITVGMATSSRPGRSFSSPRARTRPGPWRRRSKARSRRTCRPPCSGATLTPAVPRRGAPRTGRG